MATSNDTKSYDAKIKQFLKSQNADYESFDHKELINTFLAEIEAGITGKDSSLPSLPTFISCEGEIDPSSKVVAIDAGGTNLRAALVSFDSNGKGVIDNFKKSKMPGTQGELGLIEFFDTFANFIGDIANESNQIGFCFSYPVKIYPSKDGKLIKFTKEIKAPEVEGSMIGANLNKAFQAKNPGSDHSVVLLNDTVATLLAGKATHPDKNYSGFVGIILGTGYNACYLEKNINITKLAEPITEGSQIINLETGSYNKSPRGPIDIAADNKTEKPGGWVFEKMISGAYFGTLAATAIGLAAKEGLFSQEFAVLITADFDLETKDADNYLHNPYDEDNILFKMVKDLDRSDREKLYILIDRLMERAAYFAAIHFTGLILKSDQGLSPLEPLCLVVDGSTFYKNHQFETRVRKYLDLWLKEDWLRYYDVVTVKDAPLLGAAIAALSK